MNRRALQWNLTGYLLFLLVVLLVMVAFPDLADSGIPFGATLVIVNCIILFGLWRGLARTDYTAATRLAVWLAIAVPFTMWLAVVWVLAVRGTFRPAQGISRLLPALPFAIFIPPVVGIVSLTRSKYIASLLDATPASWLVGIQVYRILGGMFLVSWVRGGLPGEFALPAGIGDILVGVLAFPTALLLYSNTRFARKMGIYWNLLGLADFVVAISTGWLSSPGPLQLLGRHHPNNLLSAFPLVMVPAFAVPSAIIQHLLSIWQLRRLEQQMADTGTIRKEQISPALLS
jgi:hypothetical protein